MATKNNGVRKLTSIEAAAQIGVTDGTLRNWRSQGIGPTWHSLHEKRKRRGKGSRPRVFYYEKEIIEFLKGE